MLSYNHASYDSAVKAKAELGKQVFNDSNVVSIAVIKEERSDDSETDRYVISVGVISYEVYKNSIEQNQNVIPAKHTIKGTDFFGVTREEEIPVIVIEKGEIVSENNVMPASINLLPPAASMEGRQKLCSFNIANTHSSSIKPFNEPDCLLSYRRMISAVAACFGIFLIARPTVMQKLIVPFLMDARFTRGVGIAISSFGIYGFRLDPRGKKSIRAFDFFKKIEPLNEEIKRKREIEENLKRADSLINAYMAEEEKRYRAYMDSKKDAQNDSENTGKKNNI